MPIQVARKRNGTVAVAHCVGILTETDVTDSMSIAFGARLIEPGLDRIVIIDPDAELHELDLDALKGIQRRILDQEVQGGGDACFRSVLVYSSPIQAHVMQLYKAIWDTLELPGVEFFVVASDDEAWEIIGSVPAPPPRDAD